MAVQSFLRGSSNGVAVVVDNSDQEAQRTECVRVFQGHDRVKLVRPTQNVGYFPGLNLGLAELYADPDGFDLAVVGNNDLSFSSEFADQCERVKAIFEVYPVVSPNISTSDGLSQNPHVIREVSAVRRFAYAMYFSAYPVARAIRAIQALVGAFPSRGDPDSSEHAMEISQGHGSCYILSKIFFRDFRWLPENTFLYGEEYFLSRALIDRGYKTRYEPTIRVEHSYHASIRSLPSRKHWAYMRDAYFAEREDRARR